MFVFVCDVQDGEIPWRSEWVCPSSVFLLCTINTRTERSRQLCILLLSVSRCRLGQCNVNIVWNTWECVYYCVCFRETQMDRRCRGRQVSEGRPLGCGSKARRKRREEKCKVSAMVAADSCPSPRIHRCPLTTRRPSALVYFCLCTFVSQVSALPSFFSCHLKIEEGSYWQTAASVEEEVAKRKTRLWGGRTWGRGREIWMKCPSITFLNLIRLWAVVLSVCWNIWMLLFLYFHTALSRLLPSPPFPLIFSQDWTPLSWWHIHTGHSTAVPLALKACWSLCLIYWILVYKHTQSPSFHHSSHYCSPLIVLMSCTS